MTGRAVFLEHCMPIVPIRIDIRSLRAAGAPVRRAIGVRLAACCTERGCTLPQAGRDVDALASLPGLQAVDDAVFWTTD